MPSFDIKFLSYSHLPNTATELNKETTFWNYMLQSEDGSIAPSDVSTLDK